MAGRSASVADLISGEDMLFTISARLLRSIFFVVPGHDDSAKQKPRPDGRGSMRSQDVRRSVALSEELQEQREQVDEVQIERQGAENRCALRHITTGRGVAVDVLVLQPLGIPGGEAR